MNTNITKLCLVIVFLMGMVIFFGLNTITLGEVVDYQVDATQPANLPTPQPTISSETQRALEHIASTRGIPLEQLEVGNQHQRDYPSLGKSYWAVVAIDLRTADSIYVLVDLSDGSIIDDPSTIEQAERQARFDRYGKLEPALFDLLQTIGPEVTLQVGIWIIGTPEHTQEQLFEMLADQYPEARVALDQTGSPFDVGDLNLIDELSQTYFSMMAADTAEIVQPVVDYLQGRGYPVTIIPGIPMIPAELPKDIILDLAQRPDVGAINLDEFQIIPQSYP